MLPSSRVVEGATWLTHWKPPETMTMEPPEGDYRDHIPTRPEVIAEQYSGAVSASRRAVRLQDGTWTFGLVQCWGKRSKLARAAVHIPCCPSFSWNPLKWRGLFCGRSIMECYWFGVDRTRWARTTHALRMGREYIEPFEGFRTSDKAEIASLCWFMCCLGCACTLGIGQMFTICGNYGVNFAACYTCHAREKFRRRFNLPPACGLPPGIDDCCVHFLCLYCATHQEMREAIARGLDGPGISPLDVHPQTWAHCPGFKEEMEHRRRKVEAIKEQGLEFLPMEHRIKRDWHTWRQHLKSGKGMLNFNAYVEGQKAAIGEEKIVPLHQAPQPYQPMTREAEGFHPGKGNTGLFNVDAVESVTLQRSNSVAY